MKIKNILLIPLGLIGFSVLNMSAANAYDSADEAYENDEGVLEDGRQQLSSVQQLLQDINRSAANYIGYDLDSIISYLNRRAAVEQNQELFLLTVREIKKAIDELRGYFEQQEIERDLFDYEQNNLNVLTQISRNLNSLWILLGL